MAFLSLLRWSHILRSDPNKEISHTHRQATLWKTSQQGMYLNREGNKGITFLGDIEAMSVIIFAGLVGGWVDRWVGQG